MSFVRYNTEDSVISAETVVKGERPPLKYTLSLYSPLLYGESKLNKSYAI